jgi:acyl-CoA thioesterase-2
VIAGEAVAPGEPDREGPDTGAQVEDLTRDVTAADLVAGLSVLSLGDDLFAAESPDWWTGDRVFGGLAVAQALAAASATVDPPKLAHSLHGYFLRPAPPGRPARLRVARVRDGRTFAVRRVETTIDEKPTFSMLCSFNADEAGDEYQPTMPTVPGPDTLTPVRLPQPVEMRELGPSRRPDGTYRATRRVWLRTRGALGEDQVVQRCVAAYLSDMTGAAYRPLSLGTWGTHTDASLDHGLWFHRPLRCDEWLLYDLEALVNAGGRSTVRGVLYDRAGRLVLSMAQELLIRPLEHPVPTSVPAWTWGDDHRMDPTVL